ncbi:MAG TPA: DUF4440 domain-containing protein [Casimicrobiaceae bacterium]|nr:DUF4440 domain-containing protein [Casimicrobiaceae bacterium]
MKFTRSARAFAACLFVVAVVMPAMAIAADDAAATIRAGTAAWVKAFNAGNVDGVVATYAEDAVVMPPGSPMLRGHAAIKPVLAREIAGAQAGGVTFVMGNVNDVAVFGDTAWHSGTFSVTNKSGAVVDTGKYMEIWSKKGGKWHISRDIWNSDTPPPAPAAAQASAAAQAPAKK